MTRTHIDFRPAWLATLSLVGALAGGCSSDSPAPVTEAQPQTASTESEVTLFPPNPDACNPPPYSIGNFPLVTRQPDILGELLPKPTELGETTALHVRLPPPQNQELANSLVRVIGSPDRPQILFRSDALAQIGVIAKSPGKDFFTAFSTLPPEEIDRLQQGQKQIASGAFGKVTQESVVFDGRVAVARTINPDFPTVLRPGSPFTMVGCPLRPVSEQAAWDKALFIRDPAVVLDPQRTWDPCTGAGTPGGIWTFAHLVREMATGSGFTAEDFVTNWLSRWLNNYVVNGDTVLSRTQMFFQVIQPWATASGVTATLVTGPKGLLSVVLSGPLNLNIAPFRLLAIVNRVDLGKTVHGGGGYGPTTDLPETPGELRFIFDVVQPNPWGGGSDQTCGKKLFSTIFEYGVPGTGCNTVVNWAGQWTTLQAMPGFTPAYLTQLESMTESVVKHGAAPGRGNDNAINQIRTNEIALGSIWELREFTLTNENLAGDPAASGPLRTHTVAQTPNDGVFFSPTGANATVNSFINNVVTPSTPLFTSNPDHCAASFTVPLVFNNLRFRGGNALIPPGHWENDTITAASSPRAICARHQFSLNTCQGCHRDDTCNVGPTAPTFINTSFTQVNLTDPIPVRMSKFLTGGGPGLTFNVPDTQGLPIPNPPFAWPFADLHRRLERLFDLAFCTSCLRIILPDPVIITEFPQVPIDINPGDPPPPFKVGPIVDIGFVKELLDMRVKFRGEITQEPADVIRDLDISAH